MKARITLVLTFEADNQRQAERKVQSLLRWLWRVWSVRVEGRRWE